MSGRRLGRALRSSRRRLSRVLKVGAGDSIQCTAPKGTVRSLGWPAGYTGVVVGGLPSPHAYQKLPGKLVLVSRLCGHVSISKLVS